MKKEQIEEIISKMTLHEKVLLCTGKNSWRTRDYEKLGIPSILVSDGTSGVRFQIGSAGDFRVFRMIGGGARIIVRRMSYKASSEIPIIALTVNSYQRDIRPMERQQMN